MKQFIAIEAAFAPLRAQLSSYPEVFAKRLHGRTKRPLGELFSLVNFGVNLTRLPSGAMSSLRHAHTRQDEFIYVLEGAPVLITDMGETPLAPGMCAGFRAGSGNGHHLVNRAKDDAVYLEIGDRSSDDRAMYPDDDLQAVLDGSGRWVFTHKDGSPY
jgi:uncharacterized cupin superfamily protein